MKKLISLLLAVAVVLSCAAASADLSTAKPTNPSTDLNVTVNVAGENPWPVDGNGRLITSPTTGRTQEELLEEYQEGFGGMVVTGKYYPILVQHCGFAGAVGVGAPFYGSYADIYYEMAKSKTGHARMCMLFNDYLPKYAGGSRSLRVGYLWIRQEWNAPLFYQGEQKATGTSVPQLATKMGIPSSTGKSVGKTVPWSDIMLFNGLAGSKKWLAYKYRINSRPAECNVVWDLPGAANNLLGERNYDDHNHTLKFGDMAVEGEPANNVYVLWKDDGAKQYDGGKGEYYYYNQLYQYDPDENVYYRYAIDDLDNPENGAKLFAEQLIEDEQFERSNNNGERSGSKITKCTLSEGEPITFSNVIIQYIEMSWKNGGERPLPTLYGKGNADYFIGGKHYTGVWQRGNGGEEEYDARTVFYDMEGNEISLQAGRTMIVMMDWQTEHRGVKYENID